MTSPDASRVARAMATMRIARAVLCSIVVICGGAAPLAAQAPEPIFADAPEAGLTSPAIADPRPFVVRSRIASLRTAALQSALASPATTSFALNLFDDVTLAVSYERVENSRFGHRSWVGHIAGRPLSTVTLTQKDDIVTGLVTDGATSYEILGLGGGLHRIEQMDTANMPRDVDIMALPPGGTAPPASPALSSPSAGPTADIFVYYTSALRAFVGGQAQAESRIAQAVADTNTAYQRSGISGQLQLVGYAEIGLPDPSDPSALLSSFSSNPTVLNQREASHADLMALMVRTLTASSPNSITCGIGYVGPSSSAAFSVTSSRTECLYTFTHEVGHNFGAQHAEEDGAFAGPEYPSYARGYKAPDHSFRTVMAYDCNPGPSCQRILNYSSQSVLQAGQPTGNAMQRNAQRLNETFAQVASYRSAAPPTTPPSAPRNLQAFTNGLNVTLQWLEPASGTPTTYRGVASSYPGGADIANVPIGLTTSVAFSLGSGVFYVRMYADNAAGSSPASNEVTLVLGPPAAPTLFGSASGGTITLQWQPSFSGGAPQDYLLDAGSVSGASDIVRDVALYGTGAVFPGIPPGRYFVRLRARNSAGISAPSNQAVIDVGGCAPPPAPSSISFNRVGADVGVFWSAVSTPGAVYVIEAGSAPGAANLANIALGSVTSVSARLTTGTYYVRVRAATSCGVGPASSELTIAVP